MYNQNQQSGAVTVIRNMAVSVLFLVGAIGYSVYVLFQLVGGIAGGSGIMDIMTGIMEMNGGYGSADYGTMQAVSGMLGGMTVFSTLIGMIPVMVSLAGVWLVFAAAKRNALPGLASTGLTMIRIIAIIQLVFASIGVVVMEILCIVFMAGMNSMAGYYGAGGSITAIIIICMIVIAAVSAVQIIYYLKLSGTVRRIKDTLVTGQPDEQISLYVEIICYIGGVGSALSALMSLVGFSVYGLLANAGMATANICFAILLRKYRNMMNLLIHNPQQAYQSIQQESRQPQHQAQQPNQSAAQQPYPGQQGVQQNVPQQPYPGQQGGQQNVPQQPYPVQQVPQSGVQQASGTAYGETDILPYNNETTVLSGQMVNNGALQIVRLIRQKNGETICINKSSFWFGKEAGNVDYCITDNTAISRRHALITIRNNECYIQDNHSTNRVFLNGHVLEPGTDTLLSDGDRVRMGDEEFTVSIG